MSTRVIGYEGEGRTRRPIRVDEGPASARVERDIGMGRASLIAGVGPLDLRAGVVEEADRRAAEAKRVDQAEVRPLNGTGSRRVRGKATRTAAQHRAIGHPWAPPLRPPVSVQEEDPVSSEPSADYSETIPVAAPETLLPTLVIGCSSCVHRDVCSIRPKVDDPAIWAFPRMAYEIHPAIHASVEVVLECDHYLPEDSVARPNREEAPPAPEAPSSVDRAERVAAAERRALAARLTGKAAAKSGSNGDEPAGGGPGTLPPFLRRMVDALVEADGDRTAAAAKLGIKRTSLIGTLGKLRARTDLTEQERAAISVRAS